MLQPTTKQRRVSHVTSTAITTIALLLGCIASATAFGQSESGDKKQLTVAELKTIYLDCDRDVMRGLLGGAEAKACSVVYEELKKRAFDGDFDKFLAWSRVQNSANIAAR
jgi:hypothetical protein